MFVAFPGTMFLKVSVHVSDTAGQWERVRPVFKRLHLPFVAHLHHGCYKKALSGDVTVLHCILFSTLGSCVSLQSWGSLAGGTCIFFVRFCRFLRLLRGTGGKVQDTGI